MRFKHLWSYLPIAAKLNLFWERVTFSRTTTFYFLFSVVHCFVQVVFQIQAFIINAQAADFLLKIIEQGNAVDPGFTVYTPNGLRICESVPATLSDASCQLVWDGSLSNGTAVVGEQAVVSTSAYSSSTAGSSTVSATSAATPVRVLSSSAADVATTAAPSETTGAHSVVQLSVTKTVTLTTFVAAASSSPKKIATLVSLPSGSNSSTALHHDKRKRDIGQISVVQINGTIEVTIDGLGWNNQKLSLDQRCLYALNWPVERLETTKREDITFISFQIWVLGMSIVALLNESMPHIFASLLTHVLATAWASFQISHTAAFKENFTRLTTQGACKPINLLPSYWKERGDAEIPSLALNVLALLVSAFLSWKLIKLYGWQTFKRVGASRRINHVYKLVLSLSIAIQLSLFFIIVSIALWIDQLYNGAIGHLASNGKLYKRVLIAVLLLLLPWLAMGWVAVRRELRTFMLIFLVMSFGYLAGWGAMFASSTFRWTFVEWQFYGVIASASVFLTLITFVLGVLCRLNFGKGLSHYLNAEQMLPGDDFTPATPENDYDSKVEKVEFPSMTGAVPTFWATYGQAGDSGLRQYTPPRLGPRFTNPPPEPFETQPNDYHRPSIVPAAYLRPESMSTVPSYGSMTLRGGAQLSRQDSRSSQRSYGSVKSNESGDSYQSYYSDSSRPMDHYAQRAKRWVIE